MKLPRILAKAQLSEAEGQQLQAKLTDFLKYVKNEECDVCFKYIVVDFSKRTIRIGSSMNMKPFQRTI